MKKTDLVVGREYLYRPNTWKGVYRVRYEGEGSTSRLDPRSHAFSRAYYGGVAVDPAQPVGEVDITRLVDRRKMEGLLFTSLEPETGIELTRPAELRLRGIAWREHTNGGGLQIGELDWEVVKTEPVRFAAKTAAKVSQPWASWEASVNAQRIRERAVQEELRVGREDYAAKVAELREAAELAGVDLDQLDYREPLLTGRAPAANATVTFDFLIWLLRSRQ